MDEYHLFYKERLPVAGPWTNRTGDVFVSAFNSSPRVSLVAQNIQAHSRYWLILPEYGYATRDYPTTGTIVSTPAADQAEIIRNLLMTLMTLRTNESLWT